MKEISKKYKTFFDKETTTVLKDKNSDSWKYNVYPFWICVENSASIKNINLSKGHMAPQGRSVKY